MIDFSSNSTLFGSSSPGPQPNNPGCMSQQQNTANNFLNIYGRSASTGSAPSSSMFSLLGSSGSFIPPPTLDLNEFPSLGGSNSMTNFSSPSNSVGRPAYVGMVKEVVGNSSVNEFNIQSEDFPALPGALGGRTTGPCDIGGGGGGGGNPRPPSTPNSSLLHQFGSNLQSSHQDNSTLGPMSQQLQGSSTGNSNMTPSTSSSMVSTTTSTGSSVSTGNPCISTRPDSTDSCAQSTGNSNNQGTLTVSSSSNNNVSVSASNSGSTSNSRTSVGDKKSSVQITKDGNITNIPPGMLTDQFGMAGLVSLLQSTESSTNLFSLAIGYDITTINLNLNSKDRIYHNYPGPWNDKQLKPFEIDYPVPPEYLVHHNVRDKIADIKTNLYSEDLLFFLFYFFAGEQMQMLATNELYSRDWRFHKDEGIWLRRQGSPLEKNNNYERGTYIYFDPHNWAKMQKDMTVEYDRLETNYS
ncbi:CCR4-NOT transcription complex subunit 2 [Blomia tropicalis]|nr:CCR4-NOT transcription complex subunit 2 [Blomia tropicalis]